MDYMSYMGYIGLYELYGVWTQWWIVVVGPASVDYLRKCHRCQKSHTRQGVTHSRVTHGRVTRTLPLSRSPPSLSVVCVYTCMCGEGV